jgi:ABC-type arginine transport system ATPase subunit
MRYLLMVAVAAAVAFASVGFAEEPAAAASPSLTKVESSLIKEIGYDAATQVLTVTFVDQEGVYEYQKVPESVYKELVAAESKGSFFVKSIKDKFEFVKK